MLWLQDCWAVPQSKLAAAKTLRQSQTGVPRSLNKLCHLIHQTQWAQRASCLSALVCGFQDPLTAAARVNAPLGPDTLCMACSLFRKHSSRTETCTPAFKGTAAIVSCRVAKVHRAVTGQDPARCQRGAAAGQLQLPPGAAHGRTRRGGPPGDQSPHPAAWCR